MKLTFELKDRIENGHYWLMIGANQIYDEQELVSDLVPVFNRVDPSLDDQTGRLLNGQMYSRYFDSGPRWILTEPDSEGIRHRIGISVHPQFLDRLITELNSIGYQVTHNVSDTPSLKKRA